jgi:hypothetical protein
MWTFPFGKPSKKDVEKELTTYAGQDDCASFCDQLLAQAQSRPQLIETFITNGAHKLDNPLETMQGLFIMARCWKADFGTADDNGGVDLNKLFAECRAPPEQPAASAGPAPAAAQDIGTIVAAVLAAIPHLGQANPSAADESAVEPVDPLTRIRTPYGKAFAQAHWAAIRQACNKSSAWHIMAAMNRLAKFVEVFYIPQFETTLSAEVHKQAYALLSEIMVLMGLASQSHRITIKGSPRDVLVSAFGGRFEKKPIFGYPDRWWIPPPQLPDFAPTRRQRPPGMSTQQSWYATDEWASPRSGSRQPEAATPRTSPRPRSPSRGSSASDH